MKKLLSLAMSLALCVSGMTAVTSNALAVILKDGDLVKKYEPWEELNELYDAYESCEIYRLVTDEDGYVGHIIIEDGKPAGELGAAIQSFGCSSKEEVDLIADYLEATYNGITVERDYDGVISNLYFYFESDVYDRTVPYYESDYFKRDLKIAQDIKSKFGLSPVLIIHETACNATVCQEGDIDGNGEVTITDAAKIMSYAANPDKYPLSEMSQIVGDVYNTGDGINNMDALQIQKMLAGLE